jgi:hypothetical protein
MPRIDITRDFIRVRQVEPGYFSEFRTLDVGKEGYSKFVRGYNRKHGWLTQSVLISVQGLREKRKPEWSLFYGYVPPPERERVLRRVHIWH